MDLRERFLTLWERVGAKGDPSVICGQLLAKYSEPGRYYHTENHIDSCLDELEKAREIVDYFDEIAWALCFHDVEYDTHESDNEEKSAKLAMDVARTAGLRDRFVYQVGRLVLITKDHVASSRAGEYDERVICDIDLAIFGQDSQTFDRYEEAIRREYAWVPEEAFRKGRRKVLLNFSRRSYIFQTARFRSRYEQTARANLIRSIEKLRD